MPRRKALKVIVDIHFHAVTCPGVFLPDQQDVFLNVEILGQRKRTASVPPVFPFLFHEKLRFEKVFSHATDPVQVATALNGERAVIELVQLTYPAGELLATYDDNARDFLFPTPRVSPTYPGVDREVLLQRSSTFAGIAPKLEFSSRTVIKEVTSVGGSSHSRKNRGKALNLDDKTYDSADSYRRLRDSPIEASTPHIPATIHSATKKKGRTPAGTSSNVRKTARSKVRSASLSRAAGQKGYEASTIASRARSPSPYTRRRMAQLSVRDPFESAVETKPFKTELEERPNFVVRKADKDSLSPHRAPPPLPPVSPTFGRSSNRTPSPRNYSHSPGRRKQTPGKYLSANAYGRSRDADSEESDSSSDDAEDELSGRELEEASHLCGKEYRNFNARMRQSALKSAYYRPITSCCSTKYPASVDMDNSDLAKFLRNRDWQEDMNFSRTLSRSSTPRSPPLCGIQKKPCLPLSSNREPQKAKWKRRRGRVRFRNTAELIDSPFQHPCSRPSSARSAPESARTPRRDFDLMSDGPSSSARKLTPNSILFRTPLRERFTSSEPSPYEKIRDRVRDLLQSPRANRIIDESIAEANDRYRRARSRSPSPRPSPRSPSLNVRLAENEYWNERASEYTGRSHRRIFEKSMDKIYDDIYRSVKRSTN